MKRTALANTLFISDSLRHIDLYCRREFNPMTRKAKAPIRGRDSQALALPIPSVAGDVCERKSLLLFKPPQPNPLAVWLERMFPSARDCFHASSDGFSYISFGSACLIRGVYGETLSAAFVVTFQLNSP